MDRERARLLEHVGTVQRTVRTCDGCGACCTETYNSVRILPVEAERIARHLEGLQPPRREALLSRVRESITRYRLGARLERQPYTCPFLEPDLTCGLPFDVKPVACLAFNPVTADHCEMDVDRFNRAHDLATAQNQQAGLSARRFPIPVAVLEASGSRTPIDRPAPVNGRAAKAGGPEKAGGPGSLSKPHPLPRVLSKKHVASRAEAEALVRAGRVTVNGTIVRDVRKVVRAERDRIEVDGVPIPSSSERAASVYVVVNKPRGVVSTTKDPEGRKTVMDLLEGPPAPGLAPVGRLDQDSAGVILLTNDHDLAARLLDPKSHVAKTYRVKVKGRVMLETLERMRTKTVESEGLVLAPFRVDVESVGPRSTWLRITLEEGKNRQIRRQCAAFGHEVEVVVRMTFGPLGLGALPPGACRKLEPAELEALRRA